MQIVIYTDGACRGNPGKGGLGIVMIAPEIGLRKEYARGYRLTTNNRMELLAVIVALSKLKKDGYKVTIFSDSKYVVDAIEKKWLYGWIKKDFKDKKNKDLWLQYIELAKKHDIKFVWVKGHSSNPENNRCDALAVAATEDEKNLKTDTEYEREFKLKV